jgi:tetraacyldisaccharide 4'-kinase
MVARSLWHSAAMDSWRSRLQATMSDTGRNSRPLALILYGCSRLYGRMVQARVRHLQRSAGGIKRLPRPVISVGNLTTGGTGKTPMTAYLAGLLQSWGLAPVILSRGYGGAAEKSGRVVSTGKGPQVSAAVAGDEAYLLAQRLSTVPVVVGKDRYAMGIKALEQLKPDCFILDDGYQHIQLHRDLNLVLLDYRRPFGNGHLLPRGHLREPLTALERADALVLTRSDLNASETPELEPWRGEKPLFRSAHRTVVTQRWVGARSVPLAVGWKLPEGQKVYIFSGVAANEAFREAIAALGIRSVGFRAFVDHHPYTIGDVVQIREAAKEAGAATLLTTAKDFVRLPQPLDLTGELLVTDAELIFTGDDFQAFIRQQLANLMSGENEIV